jgi:hypothetical protein
MAQKTIHLVFKTHLDIGFTDHAEKVRRQYHERFIPQAIDTGDHFWRENPEAPAFIWTTGAWLIHDHLETQPPDKVRRLEEAIGRGLIRWHALPFTTHSELMSPDLFRAGLSYAAELDRRFGKTTIAAKMTDVPGHTRGIVPLLAAAGVKFLHLGVNTASPVPEVPEVFRWRAPDGAEIVVMYQNSYGATHFPQGFEQGLSFAHTSDNIGPQSVPQTADLYRALARDYPDAAIRAATLDDYAHLLWARRAEFPVVELELGDSWIYGAASDPQKLARFLALQRLYDGFVAEGLTAERLAFGRRLAMVPEHTWGVDIKSYLRDETAWDRPAFEAARQTDYRFAYTEASWAEQRAYLDHAVAALAEPDRQAAAAVEAALRVPPAKTGALPPYGGAPPPVAGWRFSLDPATGDVTGIVTPTGLAIAGLGGGLAGFRYESYDAADVARHIDTYLMHRADWALLDHGKPGLDHAATARSALWTPRLVDVAADSGCLMLGLAMPDFAREALGAPTRVEFVLRPLDAARLELALILRDKPANRMPEAGFLTLTPAGAGAWTFRKMGLWQPAERVASSGGGGLQAVGAARTPLPGGAVLTVEPLDAPLAAPVGADFMRFSPDPPDFSRGLRFNLHNNKWGTNFPMWCEGDLKARFVLTIGQ